jgi:hypothetical protein
MKNNVIRFKAKFELTGEQNLKALAVALSFCCLLGLGCPKQAFAKIATPRMPLRHGSTAMKY